MQTKELWSKWDPTDYLSNKFCVDSIQDEGNSLILTLSTTKLEQKGKLQITFSNIAYYSRTEENACLDIISSIHSKYGEEMYQRTFFKISNSSLIQKLKRELNNNLFPPDLTHFSFVETNSIIDVLTSFTPEVEWLEQPSPQEQTATSSSAASTEEIYAGSGKIGTLPDGRMIMVRAESTDGRPTLEIQENYKLKGILYTKIRYGNR